MQMSRKPEVVTWQLKTGNTDLSLIISPILSTELDEIDFGT
jgi:hypothetical protein